MLLQISLQNYLLYDRFYVPVSGSEQFETSKKRSNSRGQLSNNQERIFGQFRSKENEIKKNDQKLDKLCSIEKVVNIVFGPIIVYIYLLEFKLFSKLILCTATLRRKK